MDTLASIFSYFFTKTPGAFSYYIPVLLGCVSLIVFGIGFQYYYDSRKKNDPAFKRLFKHIGSRSIWIALTILALLALRYEQIPYFSMRSLFYLALFWLAYTIYKNFKVYLVDYPAAKQNWAKKRHSKAQTKDKNIYSTSKSKKKKRHRGK